MVTGFLKKIQLGILVESILLLIVAAVYFGGNRVVPVNLQIEDNTTTSTEQEDSEQADFIKWVDFTISYEALCQAYDWDVKTHDTEHEINWIELLAYTAARTGADFDKKALQILEETARACSEGEADIASLAEELKYYDYYLEAYTAVLGGLVGEYEAEVENVSGDLYYESKYGLKAYSPIARGFEYTHYDDFGTGRSYGYKRRHLGHDMMGQTGTPIIAIESGIVEALGWNQYGGWRIGIRSFDGKRYYYYAHLRKNYPYAEHLEEGSVVTAGDVIGYMGRTGYSREENTNNIETTHLHWGLELIFDESQKESDNEIWIDVYALTRFLAKHTQPVIKVEGTKEWIRSTKIIDPEVIK